jgi:hypothetical protein
MVNAIRANAFPEVAAMPVTDIPEFLDKMVGILERLRVTSRDRNQPLLASILEIARVEAEDALRHEREMAERAEYRAATSSTHSWRACDNRPGEDEPLAA